MTFEEKIRVIAILAKYLRTFAITIAAIGSEKKLDNRQLMIEKLAAQVVGDDDIWRDILYVFSAVLGDKLKENIDLRMIVEEFSRSWRHNRLDDTMLFCLQAGLISKPDLANALWVMSNWRVMRGNEYG
jgi:hypothetical protein